MACDQVNNTVQQSQQFLLLSLEFTAYPPEFYSLREGSNSGGWEDWKIELLLLSIKPGTDIGSTAMVRTLQCSSLRGKGRKP